MLKKSLLLLSTAMLIVPSTATYADKKDDRRERARQEAPRQQAREQRTPRNEARPARIDRRDMAAQAGNYRNTGPRNVAPRNTPPRNVAPTQRSRDITRTQERGNRISKGKEITHTRPMPVRNFNANSRVERDDRRQPTRDQRTTRRNDDHGRNVRNVRNNPRTVDRRDVSGGGAFNMDYKRRNNDVPVTTNYRDGRNVNYRDDHRRGGNDHRGRGNDYRDRRHDHRGRDHDRGRDHRYDHRDRRDHRYNRDRHRSRTNVYIGFGTYPYGYWGRHRNYYGHYGYGDWPYYSGYWHARAHWAWHTHHSHYHYGGYCPGLHHGYSTSYYYNEPTYYTSTTYRTSSNAGNEVAGTILGGVIGGILGSEIDGGRNRTAGIVVGSLLGATVGNSIARSNSRTVSSYRYSADDSYYYNDGDTYHYESETNYVPPASSEVRKCIEYDVRAGNYVCRRWIVEYSN